MNAAEKKDSESGIKNPITSKEESKKEEFKEEFS